MIVVDTHQHFWSFNVQRDAWITDDMIVLRRNFSPGDVRREMVECHVDQSIAVQADQSIEETNFLLLLADQYNFLSGVVGWVDLRETTLEETLQSLKAHPKLKGFRHILQGAPELMRDQEFIDGVRRLGNHNFTYDLLIYSHQLTEGIEFVRKVDQRTKIVVDHLAKPAIKKEEFNDWATGMSAIAQFENVYGKLSGMITEADWHQWKENDFSRYLDHVFDVFGPSRLMYGSDWPVCLLAGSYQEQFEVVKNYISKLSVHEKEMVMGENATRFYNL
jgi:L-fuconolactonase